MSSAAAVGAAFCMPPVRAARPSARPAGRHGSFGLIVNGKPAGVLVDAGAGSAVRHVATSFAADLQRVSGTAPARPVGPDAAQGPMVIIGVLGQSPIIDRLAAQGRLDVADLAGEWEAYRQTVVDRPFPGVPRALVITGSDRRGAVFGTYDVSERIGVSPWHWFADVPVARRTSVFLPADPRRDQPRVRYRGFFINDEAPAFSNWAIEKFGGANHRMYAHVFELLLRLKGNYLWPAMWAPRAFNADDPQNTVLADAMGVVMGTSHHEPLTRAQDEWHRNTDGGVTGGTWDYTTNRDNLRRFWRGGVERMMSKGDGRGYESLLTVGMRGDGDEAMAEGTATELLETIVADQRRIIADVTGRPAEQTPQMWALYKEVQDYYDHGMKVPDDVTLLFSDDNWGQIRRLPPPDAAPRKGGYGVYYHFDYVGGPRNYKWINTNQIEKVWQQMDLAYSRGARNIWIVNVGDIKPMEFPLSFFMRQAWNPEAMTPAALAAYPDNWAQAVFGPDQAGRIGDMLATYGRYAARRKPELIDQDSFPLGAKTGPGPLDGGEFGAMVAQWDALEGRMLDVRARLRPEQRDAYFQLVEHPISAFANLYRLYYAAAWNKRLAAANDPRANAFADQVEVLFRRDQELTDRYHQIAGGKWNHMMSQVHMSYVIWNDPVRQTMPSVTRVGGDVPEEERRRPPNFARRNAAPDGVIAIDATAFSRKRDAKGLAWTPIANLGRTGGALVALPQGRPATTATDAVRVDYDIAVQVPGAARLGVYLVPTLDTTAHGAMRIGVSVDGGPMQVLAFDLEATGGDQDAPTKARWAEAVSNNAIHLEAELGQLARGRHVLTLWRLDDNVVPQKLVVSTVPVPQSYLGPVAPA
ncbi:Glycosyl hydrolase family 115 [Sphingomonas gellani]|uniref:Glycosyl hydrolase family 115 n=1 Tax=Sphingomonas gellani TaxID=1166340 RepID=A0A1H8ILH4_9SPHN|nr:glycosyl hydrolase 115 family protein [Sphingomonas gellani]SEN69199.1 Glycosyl hydrolase family 115 [Sphingomonas gellani]